MSAQPISSRPRRILVVANETAEGDLLHRAIRPRAKDTGTDVRVVAPALNSRLRHWLSDEDGARRAAETRLDSCLERLALAGVDAHGEVGDANPIQAIADALHGFAADELVIATHPEARSHWLSRNVVERARAKFGLPITPVVNKAPSPQTIPAGRNAESDASLT